ncbi:DUF401 family protein [Metallumcola ferriviriculae]|uniref:DUF401 family protein n=1 Tax=Metallumcola ferriviriculae TaxID=3039180 RepID=A0AAU0UJE9_9FIRM|nr:DUF401 family protein [Desulfitibacteraceae bacterium MK1]
MFGVVGVLLAFIIAVLVLNRWHDFGLAMLAGSLIVVLTGGFSLHAGLQVLWSSLADRNTLELTLTVVLINALGYILKQAGILEKLVKVMLVVLRDLRLLVVSLPVIIGLLPVPGGAVMSAPLVAETGNKAGLSPEKQAAANILYRHLVYFVFPLYPTLILAESLSGISIAAFARQQALPMAAGLAVSLVVILRGAAGSVPGQEQREPWGKAFLKLLHYALPIYLVIILAVVKVPFIISVGVGILVALFVDVNTAADAWKRLRYNFLPGLDWKLALAVLGIMVFRGFVEASGSMNTIADYLGSLGVPVLLLAIVVPMLTGMATGSSLAGVGILLPLFMPLIPPGTDKIAFLSLVFISTMVGYIASPVHMCLVLTKEACQSRFGGIYPYLLPPLGAILLVSLLEVLI